MRTVLAGLCTLPAALQPPVVERHAVTVASWRQVGRFGTDAGTSVAPVTPDGSAAAVDLPPLLRTGVVVGPEDG